MEMSAPYSPKPTDEEIALGAYRIWLQEGCPHGRDREHWRKAREQLLSAWNQEKTGRVAGIPASEPGKP